MQDLSTLKIVVIVSKYNAKITNTLKTAALIRLEERGVSKENITLFEVPGAIEIPVVAKILAKTLQYNAIIVLGAVIRGETTHYDLVCEQVSTGCQQIALQFEIPVIFGVLTTENEEQAFARLGGIHGNKGIEAADSAIDMCAVIQTIKQKEL